jgi:hypothetical protein
MFGMKYIDVAPIDKIYPENEVIEFLKSEYNNEKFRVLGINRTLEPRFAVRNQIETLDGILPPTLRIYAEYITAVDNSKFTGDLAEPIIRKIENPVMLNLLNVKYILTTEILDENESYNLLFNITLPKLDVRKQLEFNQTIHVYENPSHLPRVFVVDGLKVVENPNDVLEELKRGEFNPRVYAVLEKKPNVLFTNQGNYSNSTIEISDYTPNKIMLHADMKSAGIVVLNEIWYPAWKAYIYICEGDECSDKKIETEIFKTNYLFRSVALEKGKYKIEFVYSNLQSLKNLKLLS